MKYHVAQEPALKIYKHFCSESHDEMMSEKCSQQLHYII